MKRLTAEHLEKFRGHCRAYIQKLGLHDWRVYYKLGKADGDFARIHWEWTGRTATITLSRTWDDSTREFSAEELKATARHEILHLLTAELAAIALCRWGTRDGLDAAEEALVRRIESVMGGALEEG